ncbi:MAG: hypothetical protein ABI462_01280 [Ignavibacteria bacterium]
MNRLLKLYNDSGRWGNIILLVLLILFGVINRLFMVVKYRYVDYILEAILIALALILVLKIYKKDLFKFSKPKIFKILLIAGIVMRIILGVHDLYDRPIQESDYEKHERLGARIAFEGEFYDFTGVELRNFRQPGLPVVFAIGLWICNNPVTYAIIMILFSFGVLIAGYNLFSDIKNIAALFSFAYLALSPNMLFMASSSNTQLSFFFFLILIFIALKNYKGKTYQLLIIGALLAAEMYVRFNFLMVFILIPFIIEKHKEDNIENPLAKLGIIYIACLVFYSPWIYRNYMIYGTIRFMPTTGLGFYSSNVTKDYTKVGGYNGVPDSVLNKYSKLTEVEFDNALKTDAINYIKNNPDIYIKGIPFRLIKFSDRQNWTIDYFFTHTKYTNSQFADDFFQTIENFFVWVVLFLPLFFLIKNRKLSSLPVYILWVYLSYSIVLLSISETRSRYNFPYVLFPVFAVALSGKEKDDEKTSHATSNNLEILK